MNTLILEAVRNGRKIWQEGRLPDYIPELSKVNASALGICIVGCDGREYAGGDAMTEFTVQSISKVLALILALEDHPHGYVYQHVSVTSSAEAFNSIKQLETMNGNRPLNPFINAGAILTLSLVNGATYEEKFNRVRALAERLSRKKAIEIDRGVYLSEKQTGDRNRALAYFMSSTKVLHGQIEDLLDAYFKMCSMRVTCRDLAHIGVVLANGGRDVKTGEQLIKPDTVKAVNAIMASCGMYDGSGEFAVKVGLPSKSGVGGGILSVIPGKMGVGVYGPALDVHGNSVAGVSMLEYISKKMNLSIY